MAASISSKFRLKQIEDQIELEKFWRASPHSHVFVHPKVLSELCFEVEWWAMMKGDEAICVWPFCRNEEGQNYRPSFSYYVGPFWSAYFSQAPAHRSLSLITSVYETYLNFFLKQSSSLRASIWFEPLDVRVFDWWNYHDKDQSRFRIQARYSARISKLKDQSDQEIQSVFRELRRRELRRASSEKFSFKRVSGDSKSIIDLYHETIEAGGGHVAKSSERNLERLLSLAESGWGEMIAYAAQDSTRANDSAVVLLHAKGVSNMIVNVCRSDLKGSGLGPLNVFESIRVARDIGCEVYDFNGANSPNRGDDKHSYGALPFLYFDCDFDSGS